MTTKTDTAPTSQAEAEELAQQAVQQYLNACRLESRTHMGQCLMKLCSVAGVLMAHAEGSATAAQRLEGTAAFVRNKLPVAPARMEPLQ